MSRLLTFVVRLLVAATLVVLALFLTLLFGMRTQSPVILTRVRQVNRAAWNKQAMRTAGQTGDTTSVVEHIGRRSGASYATPVATVTTDDGLAVALPYGTQADWVRNVLAAGRATVRRDGERIEVDRPELVDAAVAARWFSPMDQKVQRLFGVEQCLLLRLVEHSPEPT